MDISSSNITLINDFDVISLVFLRKYKSYDINIDLMMAIDVEDLIVITLLILKLDEK